MALVPEPRLCDSLDQGHRSPATAANRKGSQVGVKGRTGALGAIHSLYWADIGTDAQADLYRRLYPDYFAEESKFRRVVNVIKGISTARDLSVNLLGDVFGYLGQFQHEIKREVFSQIQKALRPRSKSVSGCRSFLVGHSLAQSFSMTSSTDLFGSTTRISTRFARTPR